MTTNNKTLLKKTRSNFNKIMRGARLFDFAKQLIQQPRLQDTCTQAMKQRRMHINAEKATSDGVDVELPALKRRQLSPSGSHMMMDEEDDEEALLPPRETLGEAFQQQMAIAKKAKAREYLPISGNIYRYWAMSGGVFTWNKDGTHGIKQEDASDKGDRMRKAFGMLTLLLIQVVAPPAVIISTAYKIEWKGVNWWHHDPWYLEGSTEFGVSWLTSRILGLAFIIAFSLWSLDQIEGEKNDWLKINSLLNFYTGNKSWSCRTIGSTRFWLWMGPAINCLTYLGCGVAMILLMKVADDPKDVVFDSLSLLFLIKLDDLDSDLGFWGTDDWDEMEMGTYLYNYMNEDAQELFFTDEAVFVDGDPRLEIEDEKDNFNVDKPDTLVANNATMVHPAYTLTRIALYCINIAAVMFWFCAANVKEEDSTDIADLKKRLLAAGVP